MHRFRHALLVAALALGTPEHLWAQNIEPPELAVPRVPRVSQGAESRQIVGASEITITYHRPGVKGRTIWGGLLPYGEVWRVGANEPTLITFSDPVTVNGQTLEAGTYRFLAVPGQSSWRLIFNSDVRNWGSVYDSTFDVLTLEVVPETGPHQEWMGFSFTDLTSSSARVELAWEKTRVAFTAMFNTMENVGSALGGWRLFSSAARYALDEGASDRALEWVEHSLDFERNPANTRTKAEILAKQGKYAEAVALAEESISLARARNPAADVSALEGMIADWRAKK